MSGCTVHASVALVGDSGVLIRGASGSGKSSLLLALLSNDPVGTALVADDRVVLAAVGGRLLAFVPEEIAGLMEVRGQGIVRRPHISPVVVDLIVDLARSDACPRLPEADQDQRVTVEGVGLPRIFIPVGAIDGVVRVKLVLVRGRNEYA